MTDQGPREREFDGLVQRLFAKTGGLFEAADQRAFAHRVERRLARDWTVRQLAIGTAGVVGGGVAVVQLAGAHVLSRLDTVSHATVEAGRGAGLAVGRLSVLAPALSGLPLGADSLWLVAGMAALAAALFASRLLDGL